MKCPNCQTITKKYELLRSVTDATNTLIKTKLYHCENCGMKFVGQKNLVYNNGEVVVIGERIIK